MGNTGGCCGWFCFLCIFISDYSSKCAYMSCVKIKKNCICQVLAQFRISSDVFVKIILMCLFKKVIRFNNPLRVFFNADPDPFCHTEIFIFLCTVALFQDLINSLLKSCFFPDCILKYMQGVTYCGESSASSLTMANVPWHQEVVAFVQQLADMLPQYEIACEHEHSNCLLIAHNKVWVLTFYVLNTGIELIVSDFGSSKYSLAWGVKLLSYKLPFSPANFTSAARKKMTNQLSHTAYIVFYNSYKRHGVKTSYLGIDF